jgi:L-gulono-1,4-lactone dehydrogenase
MPELWRNWSGEQHCAPARMERPQTEEAVAEAVKRAVADGRRVRVSASGHSFTDIACTDDVMLRVDALDTVVSVKGALVEVEAGITLHRLGKELADRELAMENQGDIDRQQLAGAISTATHGTGIGFPNLSAQVVALRLVTADGDVRELSSESDADAWRAARVGLGALGVITRVTLRCVPLFTLERLDLPRDLDEALAALDELVASNDHFEFYGFPYTGRVMTRESERNDREVEQTEAWKRWLNDVVAENAVPAAVFRVGRAAPAIIPALNRRIVPLMQPSKVVDHAYRVYASRRSIPFTEMEYGIPREAAGEAVRRVVDLIERRRLPVAMPYEVRFTKGDDAHLSTAAGRDTCYIAVHQYRGMDFDAYFRAVERIMDDYDGRPHWGKRHFQTAATLAPRYPDWDAFQAVRRRLDPDGVFTNEYVERVLGPL